MAKSTLPAVDFYAGSVTHAPAADEDGGTGDERGPVRVELTYLVRDDGGRIFTPLRQGAAVWPDEALSNDVRELRGVRSRLVALASLVRDKSSPRDDPEDGAKDGADFEQLSRLGA